MAMDGAIFKEDTEKYKFSHLSGALIFLPYGVAVDEFQHFVYENPNASPLKESRLGVRSRWNICRIAIMKEMISWRMAGIGSGKATFINHPFIISTIHWPRFVLSNSGKGRLKR